VVPDYRSTAFACLPVTALSGYCYALPYALWLLPLDSYLPVVTVVYCWIIDYSCLLDCLLHHTPRIPGSLVLGLPVGLPYVTFYVAVTRCYLVTCHLGYVYVWTLVTRLDSLRCVVGWIYILRLLLLPTVYCVHAHCPARFAPLTYVLRLVRSLLPYLLVTVAYLFRITSILRCALHGYFTLPRARYTARFSSAIPLYHRYTLLLCRYTRSPRVLFAAFFYHRSHTRLVLPAVATPFTFAHRLHTFLPRTHYAIRLHTVLHWFTHCHTHLVLSWFTVYTVFTGCLHGWFTPHRYRFLDFIYAVRGFARLRSLHARVLAVAGCFTFCYYGSTFLYLAHYCTYLPGYTFTTHISGYGWFWLRFWLVGLRTLHGYAVGWLRLVTHLPTHAWFYTYGWFYTFRLWLPDV